MASKNRPARSRKAKQSTEFSISDERKAELLGHARKSGVALKSSTVKAGGNYPIRFETKGTSILTRAVFAMATKAGQTTLTAKEFLGVMDGLLKDAKRLGKVPFPPEYKNLKNVAGRLRKEINDGAIVSFTISEADAQVKDIASLRKLLA